MSPAAGAFARAGVSLWPHFKHGLIAGQPTEGRGYLASYHINVLFIGLFALLQLPITMAVGIRRNQKAIMFLHGDDETPLRRIRAHANFTETVSITLLAMAAAEVPVR